ncbi:MULTISPECIES: hypothetical protein [Paracoccus]|uniref:hypothetical protein n=1 Tax=Paracoccus TaxID=265 RepID=UPI0008683809|nr:MULTISPECIES: hypothetical protein [Paracoccus]ODT60978.1 MAG: hypothetical protein ABS73_03835 [Paracoccus sp. SCN 68-21]
MTPTREDVAARIDKLRLKAFRTNDAADRQAYFDAASKWFQDRHYRDMEDADAARALRERLEAAEAAHNTVCGASATAMVQLTEASAREAAAWEAGRDAAADEAYYACGCKDSIETLTPPTEATAALTAVKDAEWNAAIEAAAKLADVKPIKGGKPTSGPHHQGLRDGRKEAAKLIRTLVR